jgi:ABC-type molybdate transport system ATPase subunit
VHKIAIFPRDIFVSDVQVPGPSINRYRGTVMEINSAGSMVRLKIKVAGNTLISEMPGYLFENMNLSAGKEAHLILKLKRLRNMDGDGDK